MSFTPVGINNFNVNNLALLTSDAFLANPSGDLQRSYTSLNQVGIDFGTDTETYQQADAVFAQVPSILQAGGNLIIIPGFSDTSLGTVAVDVGGSGYKVGDILTLVQSGASGGTVRVATVSTGAVATVTIVTIGTGYADGSGLATIGGAGTGCTITISALTTETLLQAIQRASTYTYFVGIISTNYGANTSWLALANGVQGYNNKILAIPSNNQVDIPGVFTSIGEASDNNTRCLFYSDSVTLNGRLFAAAYMSRLLSVDFEGSQTTINMNLQTLQTIDPDPNMTQQLQNICTAAGVDTYVSTAGDPGVYAQGNLNRFADQVFNAIWLVSQIEVNGYNALKQVGTKVPQTEPGMSLLKAAYAAACQQGVNNGYLAPGAWTSSEYFGNPASLIANILQNGFYIYSQPVNQQNPANRALRQSPLVQIAVKEAGAINSSIVNIFVNP